jgi:hypothetical protein
MARFCGSFGSVVWLLCVVSLAIGRLQDAASTDAIAAELKKAQEAYQDVVAKASAALLAAFTAEEQRLKDNSTLKVEDKLKRIEQLQAEQKAFVAEGKLPASQGLKPAVAEYQKKVAAARATCEKAFDTAADKYVKTDVATAKAVLAEKTRFFAAESKADPLDAKFAKNSRWKGTFHERRAAGEISGDVLLMVTKREGNTFEGAYEVSNGKYRYLFEGTIDRGQVTFKFTKLERPNEPGNRHVLGLQHKGALTADPKTKKPTLNTTYSLPDPKNPTFTARGNVTLVLEE